MPWPSTDFFTFYPRAIRDSHATGAPRWFSTGEVVSIRAPRGARPATRCATSARSGFNPPAPRGARRHCGERSESATRCFNPRAPRGARPRKSNLLRLNMSKNGFREPLLQQIRGFHALPWIVEQLTSPPARYTIRGSPAQVLFRRGARHTSSGPSGSIEGFAPWCSTRRCHSLPKK